MKLLRWRLDALSHSQVELAQLLVTQRVSRRVGEYKVVSVAVRAMKQLASEGKQLKPGQYVQSLLPGKSRALCSTMPECAVGGDNQDDTQANL